MKPVIHNKLGSAILIVAGLIIWLGSLSLIPHARELEYAPSYAIGALAFFIVGCFLPEYRTASFFSRKSAVGLMAVFSFVAARGFLRHSLDCDKLTVSDQFLQSGGVPILIGFIAYWLAIFLIRGFRATPEYISQNSDEQGSQSDQKQGDPVSQSTFIP